MDNIDRTGEERIMSCGMKAKIIAYKNCGDMIVEFEDGYIVDSVQYANFKRGIIKNPYAKTIKV